MVEINVYKKGKKLGDGEVEQQQEESAEPHYPSFYMRVFATTIDLIIMMIVLMPFMNVGAVPPEIAQIQNDYANGVISAETANQLVLDYFFYGGGLSLIISERITEFFMVGFAVVGFWMYRGGTPGKMLLAMKIVDAKTGGKASDIKLITRYLAYLISAMPLGLGFIWILFNRRRRAWHDFLSGTVVISTKLKYKPKPLSPFQRMKKDMKKLYGDVKDTYDKKKRNEKK